MKHIEKIEKLFDEKFVDKVKNINGGFAYEEMRMGEQQDPQEIRDFLRTSHTSFVTDLIQRVEGERRTDFGEKGFKDITYGFNTALDTIIRLLKEEI